MDNTWVNAFAGRYTCSVVPIASDENLHLAATINTDIHLRAVVTEAVGQPEVVSEVASFSFIPAFYLLTTELHVSNMQPVAYLKLSANDKVLKDLAVCISCLHGIFSLVLSVVCNFVKISAVTFHLLWAAPWIQLWVARTMESVKWVSSETGDVDKCTACNSAT